MKGADRRRVSPPGSMGVITAARIAHGDAGLETLEAARLDDSRSLLDRLQTAADCQEAFVLQTCHRVEVYVVAPTTADGEAAIRAELPDLEALPTTWLDHPEASRHLLRVAAGLESMVLGEDQILGQLRRARTEARERGALADLLGTTVDKAIRVGERARTETRINEGVVSLARAAVTLADRRRGIDGSVGLVVGAGEMSQLAAQALADEGVEELVIANRSESRAEKVAASLPTTARVEPLSALECCLPDADVIITATGSPEYVIDRQVLRHAGGQLLVDLANPRDVEPDAAARAAVEHLDLDDLETITENAAEERGEAVAVVEDIIEEELARLERQLKRKQADTVIADMWDGAESTKQRELRTALRKLEASGEFSEEQREIVEDLADVIVGRLLAAPTKSLRDAAERDDWQTLQLVVQWFDPEFEDGAVRPAESSPPGAESPATDSG